MSDKQNQFYTSISKYYSEIFPYKPMQLDYVRRELMELEGKRILDIGCATGELAFQLAINKAHVVGIDLNADLLEQAQKQKIHSGVRFQKGNMLHLQEDFKTGEFDAVLCFGNTLVHLPSEKLIEEMLRASYAVLKPGGCFLLQILNYDYILDKSISELPLIETDKVKFIRKYEFPENSDTIGFITDLEIKSENKVLSNETALLALQSNKLLELLKAAGFHRIQLYSNFKKDTFGGSHIPLVLSCKKPN